MFLADEVGGLEEEPPVDDALGDLEEEPPADEAHGDLEEEPPSNEARRRGALLDQEKRGSINTADELRAYYDDLEAWKTAKRFDPSDGKMYTADEFRAYYGDLVAWEQAPGGP